MARSYQKKTQDFEKQSNLLNDFAWHCIIWYMAVANSLLVFPLGSQNLQSAPSSTRHGKPFGIAWLNSMYGYREQAMTGHALPKILKTSGIYRGAIAGKQVSFKSLLNSGLLYHNYKGFFSMILMAICDARYKFTLVDIGSFGSNNDSGVFRNSPIGKALFNDEISLPVAECLGNSPTFGKVPYFLVGDKALCSLCLDHILAKEYSKNKRFSIIDYLGHVG